VLVKGRQAGAGKTSGVEVEDEIHSVWTFRDGRIVSLVFERDEEKALEAAGLRE
jgi:ketosteroid isomerase-like protein